MKGNSNQYIVQMLDANVVALLAIPSKNVLVIDWIVGSLTNSTANAGAIIILKKDDDSTEVMRFPQTVNNGAATGNVGWNYTVPNGMRLVDAAGEPINFQVTAANRAHAVIAANAGTLSGHNVVIGYHFEP